MHSTNNRLFKDFSWSAPLLFTIYFPYPVSLPVCLPFGKACCHYSPCELCVYVPAVLLTFHFSKCMLLIMKAFSPQAGELFGSTHYPCVCMCVCVCVCVCGCMRACVILSGHFLFFKCCDGRQMYRWRSKDKHLWVYLHVCFGKFNLRSESVCFCDCA